MKKLIIILVLVLVNTFGAVQDSNWLKDGLKLTKITAAKECSLILVDFFEKG